MSSFMVGRYTLDSISLADLSPPQTCWLGHGRGRSPMTLPQRKAAGMHDPWRRYHRYSPKCVEGLFSEVRRTSYLRTSQQRIKFTQYESDVLCPRSILLMWRIFGGA